MNSRKLFSNQQCDPIDVLLINMPFGPLKKPSIGLSLLQSSLHGNSTASSRIAYFTLFFAKRIGVDLYEQMSAGSYSSTEQVGEWVFAPALFPEQNPNPYLETVLFVPNLYPWQDETTHRNEVEIFSKALLSVRAQVDAFINDCLTIILQYHPKIVGFTSTFQQQIASLALAQRIKECSPHTSILFGGANTEGVMGIELVRQFPFVDAVVSGEGDIIFPELVTRILGGISIDNLLGVYTHNNTSQIQSHDIISNAQSVSDMNSLPYPDYDDFFMQQQELGLDIPIHVLYETSRGCWWGAKSHCTFCGLNGSTMNFRSKSPDRALGELKYLAEHYPGHTIAAVDNILDMKYFKTFLPKVAKLGIDINLFYEVKANLRKDQLVLLRQANVRMIQPGIESFSTQVLRIMRKGIRSLQNIQLLKWCKELGIDTYWNLIWGFPGELPEEYICIEQMIPLLTHLQPPRGGGPVRLDRFSPLFVSPEQYGLTNVRPTPSYQSIYTGLSEQSLANLAYYFTFDYVDGRYVPDYTYSLVQKINLWQQDYERSFLCLFHYEEDIFIWDLRPVATEMLIRLTGLERALYLACDAIQGLDSLVEIAELYIKNITRQEVHALMQIFVDMKLMLTEADTYLSLAVWLDNDNPRLFQYQASLAVLARLQRLPEPIQL